MDERKSAAKHKVVIENRELTSIEGVEEVISFDEESVICETTMGTLMIRGNEMHVEKLNLEQGILTVTGEVETMEYSEPGSFAKTGGGILGRIFK